MSPAPANWYPDPHDASQLRYWDGQQWTEHRAPNPAWRPETASGAPAAPTPGDPRHAAPAMRDSTAVPREQRMEQPVAVSARRPAGEQAERQRGAGKVVLFGARAAAHEAAEAERLRAELDRLGGGQVVTAYGRADSSK
jgi:hypothetical protein